jgi:5'-nucleotidase
VVEKIDPRGKKYYWIAGGRQVFSKRGDTDIKAVWNSHISITPMHLDLTDYASMNLIRKWKL